MSDEKVLRSFGLSREANPTHVEIMELSDGSMNISLSTKREGMDNLTTGFRVTAKTFELLTWAMNRAAHDPTVWQNKDDQ